MLLLLSFIIFSCSNNQTSENLYGDHYSKKVNCLFHLLKIATWNMALLKKENKRRIHIVLMEKIYSY